MMCLNRLKIEQVIMVPWIARILYQCVFVSCLIGSGLCSNKLLLVMIDGLRYDYLNEPGLEGFQRMADNGVRADYMIPSYPTVSYTNYYSIMTGLYSESHGMVENFMYDPEKNETFLIGTKASDFQSFWWNEGDPLWITAKRQGLDSYWWQWPGCEAENIRGLRPTFCDPYTANKSLSLVYFKESLNMALDTLQQNKADLAGVYYYTIDHIGHKYGPFSNEVLSEVRKLSTAISELLDARDKRGLSNVNVVLFSDHGMQQVDRSRTINLTDYISHEDILLDLDRGSAVALWTAPEKTQQVYNKLKNAHPKMQVYLKEEIPERFYLKNNKRVPPIWLMADKGWFIVKISYGYNGPGAHGFDNDYSEMRAVFTAMGPDFRKKYRAPGFPNVDVYQLFCHILNIEPSPHNGTWDHVACMLSKQDISIVTQFGTNILFFFVCVIIIFCK